MKRETRPRALTCCANLSRASIILMAGLAIQPGVKTAQAQPCQGTLFTGPDFYPINADERSVSTADVNNDGNVDLIAPAERPPGTALADISIFLGTGEDNFDEVIEGIGYFGPGVAVPGDFNNDGNIDLYLTNFLDDEVWLGGGTGDFTFFTEVENMIERELTVGDFNDDGHLDVAGLQNADVVIRFGDGTGAFPTTVSKNVGGLLTSVVSDDFDNDGVPELAVVNDYDTTVTILNYDSKGGLSIVSSIVFDAILSAIDSGDFNMDGHVDLAVGVQKYSPRTGSLAILIGDGTGEFKLDHELVVGEEIALSSLASAHFTGDGATDLLVGFEYNAFDASGGMLRLFVGLGNARFEQGEDFTSSASPHSLDVADLDGDGDSDVLTILDTVPDEDLVFGPNDLEAVAVLRNCEGGCHGDVAGGDNFVDVADLLELLSNWNASGDGAEIAPPFDVVDVSDLLTLLGQWNQLCPEFSQPPAATYAYDDGGADYAAFIAWSGGSSLLAGDVLWLHRYDAVDGSDVIDRICTTWGTNAPALYDGQVVEWVVYNDDGNDNDAATSTLLASGTAAVEGAALPGNNFQCVNIPPTRVEGSFFVGIKAHFPAGAYGLAVDHHAKPEPGDVWIAIESNVDDEGFSADINDLTTFDTLGPANAFWLLRAD